MMRTVEVTGRKYVEIDVDAEGVHVQPDGKTTLIMAEDRVVISRIDGVPLKREVFVYPGTPVSLFDRANQGYVLTSDQPTKVTVCRTWSANLD